MVNDHHSNHLHIKSLLLLTVALIGLVISGCGPAKTEKVTLTINVEGSGTVTPVSGTTFDKGTAVTLTATPASGWTFSQWAGPNGGSVVGDKILMDANKSITAVFKKSIHNLSTNVVGYGSIKEEVVSAKSSYENGTQVRLTAVPSPGWYFKAWNGDLSGNVNPAVLSIDGPKSVTAVFETAQFVVDIAGIGEHEFLYKSHSIGAEITPLVSGAKVTRVDFYIDGVQRGTDSTPPYSWSWDCTFEEEGDREITVKAYGPDGYAAIDSIPVRVSHYVRQLTYLTDISESRVEANGLIEHLWGSKQEASRDFKVTMNGTSLEWDADLSLYVTPTPPMQLSPGDEAVFAAIKPSVADLGGAAQVPPRPSNLRVLNFDRWSSDLDNFLRLTWDLQGSGTCTGQILIIYCYNSNGNLLNIVNTSLVPGMPIIQNDAQTCDIPDSVMSFVPNGTSAFGFYLNVFTETFIGFHSQDTLAYPSFIRAVNLSDWAEVGTRTRALNRVSGDRVKDALRAIDQFRRPVYERYSDLARAK